MLRGVRVSLANKCQLLFGLAVLLILGAALTVVGWRMQTLVQRGPQRRAQDLADLYLAGQIDFAEPGQASAEAGGRGAMGGAIGMGGAGHVGGTSATGDAGGAGEMGDVDSAGLIITRIDAVDFDTVTTNNPFLAAAVERFVEAPDTDSRFEAAVDSQGQPFFRYARAIRGADVSDAAGTSETAAVEAGTVVPAADPLVGVLLIELRDQEVAVQQVLNRFYTIAAGVFAGLLAIAVFWYITTRLILSPVRVLRGYAQRVSEGDLSIRSDINTGDEFEQLSDVFNTMLENLKSKQDQLASANQTLDLKLVDLAESNVTLYEANKLKGEFLANVSHELRTPLNSIIGFAQVMQETLADRDGPVDQKRKRYAENIILSSRRLLELINDLLDLAKIEAGRMDVRITTVSVRDTCEGLTTLIKPQADQRGIRLALKVAPDVPLIETDPGKLQQILFNFLANAVKFTPDGGMVTLTATLEPNTPPAGYTPTAAHTPADPPLPVAHVRIAIADTGPGIAPDDQEHIFEKFTQLDTSVTREHGGTGLGLTISRELTDLLRGRIELDSVPGRGATFSLILPLVFYHPHEPGPAGGPAGESDAPAVTVPGAEVADA